ncbi:sensor histidine kinase [Limnochorda pilosa]|uniref:histidine kinase n=1 Tax=Limnochorda pilosa TaxID=1555112 RepID=A0A0K2SKE2_LIMPI|nr:HAMP domain-containing sensor histidine kinase [Limnochorda pilosa]BAS27565.1 hypothetical protein LIP_1719 [Limnochorda pilosa]
MHRFSGRAGLRGQLLLYSIVIVVLALGLVWGGSRVAFERAFQSYRSQAVEGQAQATADAVVALLTREQGGASEMSLLHLAGVTSTRIRWLDAAGRVRLDTGATVGEMGMRGGMGMGMGRSGRAGWPWSRGLPLEPVEGAAVARALPGGLGRVEVRPVGIRGVLQPQDVAFKEELDRSILTAAVASLALASLAALLGARVVGRPIERMGAAVHALPDLLPEPVPEAGPREVRELARGINAMSRRLHLLEHLRRKGQGEVAHQLRTPLAILRGYLEAVRDRVMAPDQAVEEMERAVSRLDRLAEELSRLSRADRMEMGLTPGQVAWEPFVADLGRAWAPAAARAGIHLEVDARPSGLVEADPEAVSEAAGNLLENALRYTPGGGRVTLRGGGDASWVWLDVVDTGPGIEPDEQPFVFERFFRGRGAEEGSTGTGLGLAIARQLVAAHGGRIELESTPGQGSRFRLRLPRRFSPPIRPLPEAGRSGPVTGIGPQGGSPPG